MERRKRRTKNDNGKVLIILLIIVILIAGGIFLYKHLTSSKEVDNEISKIEEKEEIKVVKKLKIVDEDSKSRPYAVVINNNHAAWPLCGVQDAYLAYEFIAEGGITRILALYKDKDTAKIGSIRSARHYFIDYALENDAIFVHWGGSPQAYSRLYSGIDHLDGIALEGSVFFRDKTLKRDYEHTGFTSMENVKEYAQSKGYTRDTNKDLLLNYSVDEVEIDKLEGAQSAAEVEIEYSDYHTTSYEYDEENKVYKRIMSGKPNVDLETGEQYTVKNIIVYDVSNYTLDDGEGKGRQELNNIGSGNGYYITNGYAMPITWEKTSESSQTVYKYSNGEEITVNDGNTFIQIYPKTTGELTITPKAEEVVTENNNTIQQ